MRISKPNDFFLFKLHQKGNKINLKENHGSVYFSFFFAVHYRFPNAIFKLGNFLKK